MDRFKEIKAQWTPEVNLVLLECMNCKQQDWFKTSRVKVWCKTCLNQGNMHMIRERSLREDKPRYIFKDDPIQGCGNPSCRNVHEC